MISTSWFRSGPPRCCAPRGPGAALAWLLLATVAFASVAAAETNAGGTPAAPAASGPHGGCLVPLEDAGVAEFLLDAETGHFHLFLWDGALENPVRSKQQTMFLKLDIPGETQARLAMLQPQANAATGEDAGDTSQFTGGAEQLKGASEVGVIVDGLALGGRTFRLIEFRYPEGLSEAWPAWRPPAAGESEAP